jgi:EpsI family protein
MGPSKVYKKPSLRSFFQRIAGYKVVQNLDLNQEATNMLDLDDYTFLNFDGKNGKINLYIGYYATANKAYAAHSPLICYPSHGWEISEKPTYHTLAIGQYRVNYEEIATTLGEERELVLYWYQTHERSNTLVYRNKIDMGYNKLINNDAQHAFVRVAVPFANRGYNDVKACALDFVAVLYPQIVDFFAQKGEEIRPTK